MAYGSQQYSDFLWDVLDGRSAFHIVKVFRQEPLSLEQWLTDVQALRPIGTSIPKVCVMISAEPLPAAPMRPSDAHPPLYYSAGW
jgi:hypothetical protein